MSNKLSQLDAMMQKVAKCDLCCKEGPKIKKEKLLRNFITEKPKGPRYGEIPSMYTDWAHRLDAKIAIVLQDWGSENEALALRREYENKIKQSSMNPAEAWRQTIRERPEHLSSDTHKNIIDFLKRSAELQKLQLEVA